MADIHLLRKRWEKARRLRLKQPSASGLSEEQQLGKARDKLQDLALVLELLFSIYSKGEYGDEFLAFVGDKVIRDWPGKDFPFFSKDAAGVAQDLGAPLVAGLCHLPKELKGKLHYEHWTPISFFRDVFQMAKESNVSLGKDDFYGLLWHYYRIVWISGPEHGKLDKRHRAARQIDTYDEFGIVVEHPLWEHPEAKS